MERCQRCGEEGEDRRTLYHSCFYDMKELDIPFELVQMEGTILPQTGEKEIRFGTFPAIVSVFEPVSTDPIPPQKRVFYTLRVCKACRGSWLAAIKDWFTTVPKKKPSPGTGIYVRRNGATVEISQEEWDKDHPGQEPVRYLPTE